MKEENKGKNTVFLSTLKDYIESHPDSEAREVLTRLLLIDQTTGAGTRLKALGTEIELPKKKIVIPGDLEDKVSCAIERKGVIAVLYTDLNNLKRINDVLGHKAGDDYLRHAVAQLRDGDICRIGGDELLSVLDFTKEFSIAKTLAKRVVERGEDAYEEFIVAKKMERDIGKRTGVYNFFINEEDCVTNALKKTKDPNQVARYVVEHLAERAAHRIMNRISDKAFEIEDQKFVPRGPTGMVLYQGREGDNSRKISQALLEDSDNRMILAKEYSKAVEGGQNIVVHSYFDRRRLGET
jgi:diguanylate cyclase (GGDEF)-like protein